MSSKEVLLLVGMILMMFLLIMAAGMALVLQPDLGSSTIPAVSTATTPSTAATTSSTSTSTTVVPEASATTTTVESYTTTSTTLLSMYVSHTPSIAYSGGSVAVNVSSWGKPVDGASVYVDGSYSGGTSGGGHKIAGMAAGLHNISVAKDGYQPISFILNVSAKSPAQRPGDVRRILSQAERDAYIRQGYISVRYYYVVVCPKCREFEPRLDRFVNENSECIILEKINLNRNDLNWDDLKSKFGATVSTPITEFEGSNGLFTAHGNVPTALIENYFARAGGCGVRND